MRINTTTALLSAGLVFLSVTAFSQQQRFRGGIVAGVTASQIDGDASAGYNKVGLQAGLRVAAILKEKQDISVEIAYTQRGCRNEAKTPPYFKTTLNYVEVPVQWHYHDWLVDNGDEAENFYRVHFNVGASYARLINYTDSSDGSIAGITPALPDLNRNSFCFLIGASFYASKHFAFNFRYNRAINKLYKPGKPGTNYAYSLNEHFLALQAMYMF